SFLDHLIDYLIDMMHWLPAMLVLLTLVVCDMLNFSQRILMPVVRVREAMQTAVAHCRPDPIPVDEDGFLQDLVDSYNGVCASVNRAVLADGEVDEDELLAGPLSEFSMEFEATPGTAAMASV